ncbi:MAG: hypothetical protein K2Z25_09480 [Beijerinckiaceae bacterium]|nr:hypothetical protein [Beijerinckiaceae bacterium]
MSHRLHHDRRSVGLAWLRLAAALAVMLLAVLPHATLAASAGHAASPAGSSHHPAGHHDAAPDGEPCHESAKPEPTGHGAMPSCCILGCGLIATSLALTAQIIPARWEIVGPLAPECGDVVSPEPAERPPRADTSLA